MTRACIVGAGSWGSAFSLHLARLKIPTHLWVREEDILAGLHKDKENRVFLPGFIFPPGVSFYGNLEEAISSTDIVFLAVPSQFARSILVKMAPLLTPGHTVVSLTKGIEEKSLKRMSEVMGEVFLQRSLPRVAVLSGPSFAREVAQLHPTAVVVASRDKETARNIQQLISNVFFRVYTSEDVTGVELAGALKNVIAVAAGISDGLDFGHNSRAALITRGLAEIMRLGKACGARRQTFFGLSGIGDLVLTCTANLSRNYSLGHEVGRGKRLDEVLKGMKMVAEGVATALSVHDLARRAGVEMPICEQVYLILYKNKDPRASITELMSRRLKAEHEAED